MDSERTLRMIFGPASLAVWLVVGALLTKTTVSFPPALKIEDLGKGLAVVAAGGVLLGVAGYAISLTSILLFRALRCTCWDVELPVDLRTLVRMRNRLIKDRKKRKAVRPDTPQTKLAIVVAHQTAFWKDKAITWADRRWMNVGICANGIVGVGLAYWIGMCFLHYPFDWEWTILSLVLWFLFLTQIVATRRELGRMHWLSARWSAEEKKKDG